MKHGPTPSRRLPHQLYAAIAFLKNLRVDVVAWKDKRNRFKLSWRVGSWHKTIFIPSSGHAGELARAACDQIRALFSQHAVEVA